jgi:hypothetical protein
VDVSALLAEFEVAEGTVPDSYVEVAPEDLGLSMDSIGGEFLTVSKLALYMSDSSLEAAMVMLFSLESEADRVLFDAAVADSEILVDAFVQSLAGDGSVTQLGPVTGLEGIGDVAAGYAFQYTELGVVVEVQVVVFRHGAAGAMTAIMYLSGQTPQVPVGELARASDEGLAELLD